MSCAMTATPLDTFTQSEAIVNKFATAPGRPKVYLAGKIDKNCWRHRLIPRLREALWEDGYIQTSDCTYMGPYFVSCDHGCSHYGDSTHAAGKGNFCVENYPSPIGTINRCIQGVKSCDILFAYINAHQCYGTTAEIQLAVNQGKHVVVAFAPDIAGREHNDFWFVSEQAHRVEFGIAEEELSWLFLDVLNKWSAY